MGLVVEIEFLEVVVDIGCLEKLVVTDMTVEESVHLVRDTDCSVVEDIDQAVAHTVVSMVVDIGPVARLVNNTLAHVLELDLLESPVLRLDLVQIHLK